LVFSKWHEGWQEIETGQVWKTTEIHPSNHSREAEVRKIRDRTELINSIPTPIYRKSKGKA
jgi:hypothetical protein